jgi:hypothetical protein
MLSWSISDCLLIVNRATGQCSSSLSGRLPKSHLDLPVPETCYRYQRQARVFEFENGLGVHAGGWRRLGLQRATSF